jgi:predicted extracellular nuclease
VRRKTRIAVVTLFSATLAYQLSAASSAQAQATDLFISEYVEGSSNNKAIEIYNGTLGPINLAAGMYTIEMYFNAGTTPSLTQALTGTVAANDVFVLTNPAATLAGILSASDQTTTSSAWYNGNDSVVLKKNGVILDAIGQIASNPATEWGTGLTSTADNTLQRKSTLCQGDTNPNDVFDPSIEWNGFATDNVSGLGAHTASCSSADNPPSVTSTAPANAGTLDASGNVVITWSEPVSTTGTWFTLICGGSAVAVSQSGTGNTRTLDPTASLPAGASCTLTILAGQVSDTDGAPTPMTANYVTQFNVVAGCGGGSTTLISAIQGSGSASPMVGSAVDIEGVVVGDFQGSPDGLSGFNVQEEVVDQDGNTSTSEGIFVFDDAGSVPVQVGDVVRVRGTVQEYFNLTELASVTVTVCSSGATLPPATSATMPVAAADTWERWEGMRVSVTGPSGNPLVVSENYGDGQYGEVVLAVSRLSNPTNIELPTSSARLALADLNARSRIQLDDGRSRENPATPVPIPYVGTNGTLRLGDTLTLGNLPAGQRVLTGVLSYSFGVYEIQPTVQILPASWTASNPRPGAPTVSGRLKVVTMNVLNYFKTLDVSTEGACASSGACCGPNGTLECRGAQTASELARQEAKLQVNMKALNADVFALQEIENPALTGPRASELALSSIVALLNTAPNAAGTYAYITTGTVGGDAIKVGLIYKVSKVQPLATYQIIDNSDCATYRDNRSRPSLAQTFREIATGAKFTALVAHLKSKGSSCSSDGDPLDPNGQGECNGARLAAAQCIRNWLATDPTASGDGDFLLLGDMNAYTREDPITYLESNGYADVLRQPTFDGPGAYDFVFEGESGALSHAIASTSLMSQIAGAITWHVNADEPRAFDYNDFNQAAAYTANEFRTADHDPIVLGLNLTAPVAGPSVPASDLRWLSVLALALSGVGLYASRRGGVRLRA